MIRYHIFITTALVDLLDSLITMELAGSHKDKAVTEALSHAVHWLATPKDRREEELSSYYQWVVSTAWPEHIKADYYNAFHLFVTAIAQQIDNTSHGSQMDNDSFSYCIENGSVVSQWNWGYVPVAPTAMLTIILTHPHTGT